MLKYCVLVLATLAVNAYAANSTCCGEKERTTSYLDIAIDLLSRAKRNLPDCQENKDVKEDVEEDKNECPEVRATDCADWHVSGYNKSGVYKIWPVNRLRNNMSVDVYCDMDTNGGGYTVIQRRGQFGNPIEYFSNDWETYKNGFGDLEKEFWLGNDNIFALTNQKPYSSRFDVQDKNLIKGFAEYSEFWIDDEYHRYNLHISDYNGDIDDGMVEHNHCNFTTKDLDENICSLKFGGGWWYKKCYHVNLNGKNNGTEGIKWNGWRRHESLIWTEIKIRPRNFVK